MVALLFVLTLLLGTVVGSFLNVLIDRLGRRETIRGRSYCERCEHVLRWFELFPVLSFLLQKRKCRKCQEPLSYQYPIVELGTGIVFVLVLARVLEGGYPLHLVPLSGAYLVNATLWALFGFVMASLLIVIFVYDLKWKVIPNPFSYTFSLLALIVIIGLYFLQPDNNMSFLLQLLAGPVLALPFALLWYASKGKWMGLGDAKLILGIGWLFGFMGGLTALMIAFWSGAIVGLGVVCFEKIRAKWGQQPLSEERNELTMKSELPFAPFLIFGIALVFFGGMNFFLGTYQIFIFSF